MGANESVEAAAVAESEEITEDSMMGANQSGDIPDNSPFTLELRLMRAKHILPYNEVKGLSDPYAVIKMEKTGQVHTTPTCKNTIEPFWYHCVKFNEVMQSDVIIIELWDESTCHEDELMGKSTFSVRDVLVPEGNAVEMNAKKQKQLEKWIELEHESGSYSVIAINSTENEYSLHDSAPERAFSQFINKKYRPSMVDKIPFKQSPIAKLAKGVVSMASNIAGSIHPALEIDSTIKQQLRSHSTYAVKLSGIEEIFEGKMHGYNENYSAAKRIFEGKLSFGLKNALLVQHNFFYGKTILNSTLSDVRKDFYLTSGNIIDGIDLGNLLQFGDRNGKNRVYTYVIIDDEFRFCESGAAFMKDIESKHAMHAAAKPEVVYAGEFHWKKVSNSNVLIIDNESGTYAPDKDDLPKVKELLKLNFPDIKIHTYHYEDPILVTLKQNLSREVLE